MKIQYLVVFNIVTYLTRCLRTRDNQSLREHNLTKQKTLQQLGVNFITFLFFFSFFFLKHHRKTERKIKIRNKTPLKKYYDNN